MDTSDEKCCRVAVPNADHPVRCAEEVLHAVITDQSLHAAMALKQPPPLAELRLVLLGRKGVGKSAAANTVLGGAPRFESGKPTEECVTRRAEVAGRRVTVVDTPGWEWYYPLNSTPNWVRRETSRSVSLCPPGPHAVLLVVRACASVTDAYIEEMEEHLEPLGGGVWEHTMLLFTRGDELGLTSMEQRIAASGPALRRLLHKCGNRHHVVNNLSRGDGTQVKELIRKLEQMVEDKAGGCDHLEMDHTVLSGLEADGRRRARERMKKQRQMEAQIQRGTIRAALTSDGLQGSKLDAHQSFSKASRRLPEVRLLLLGERETGKSAAGNTILGGTRFFPAGAVTEECVRQQAQVAMRLVTVVDTPGWEAGAAGATPERVKREIACSVALCPPGPHALLLTLRVDTLVRAGHVREHLELLGEGVWRHTILLFTHGDQLREGVDIQQHVQGGGRDLQWLLERCRGRYHVISSVEGGGRGGSAEVTELLEKVEKMAATNRCEAFSGLVQEVRDLSQQRNEKFNQRLKELGDKVLRQEVELRNMREREMKSIRWIFDRKKKVKSPGKADVQREEEEDRRAADRQNESGELEERIRWLSEDKEREMQDLSVENERIRIALNQSRQERDKLTLNVELKEREIEELKERIEEQQVKLLDLERTCAESDHERKLRDDDVRATRREAERLEETVEREKTEWTERVHSLQAEMAAMKRQCDDALQRKEEETEREVKRLEEKLNREMETKLCGKDRQHQEETERKMCEMETMMETAKVQHRKEMDQKLREREEEMETVRRQHENEISRIKQENQRETEKLTRQFAKDMEEQVKARQKQLSELEEKYQVQMKEKTSENEKEKKRMHQNHHEVMEQRMQEKEEEIAELKLQHREEMTSKTNNMTAERQRQQREMDRNMKEHQERVERLKQENMEILRQKNQLEEEAKQRLQEREREITELRQKYITVQKNETRILERLRERDEETEEFKRQLLHDAQAKTLESEEEKEKYRQEMEKMVEQKEKEIEEMRRSTEELKQKLREKEKNETDQLKNRREMEERLEEKEREREELAEHFRRTLRQMEEERTRPQLHQQDLEEKSENHTCGSVEMKRDEVVEKLQEKDEELELLRRREKENADEIFQLKLTIEQTKSELKALAGRMETEMMSMIGEYESEIRRRDESVESTAMEKDGVIARLREESRRDASAAAEKHRDDQRRVEQLQERNEKMRKEMDDFKLKQEELEREGGDLRRQVRRCEEQVESKESEMQRAVVEKDLEVGALRQANNSLQVEMEKMKEGHEEERMKMDEVRERLEREMTERERDAGEKERELSRRGLLLEEREAELEGKEEELRRLEANLEMQREVKLRAEDVEKKEREMESLLRALEGKQQELSFHSQELQEKVKRLKDQDKEVKGRERELLGWRSELQERTERVSSTTQQLEEMGRGLALLKGELLDKEKHLRRTSAKLNEWQRSLEAREAELQENQQGGSERGHQDSQDHVHITYQKVSERSEEERGEEPDGGGEDQMSKGKCHLLTPRRTEATGEEGLKVVVLGESWSSRSPTGLTVLVGEDPRPDGSTFRCWRGQLAGRNLAVAEPLGLRWRDGPAPAGASQRRSLMDAISWLHPGPDVVLLLMPAMLTCTREYRGAVEEHVRVLGEDVWRRTLLLLTWGETLGVSAQRHVLRSGELRGLLEKCGGGLHVLSSRRRNAAIEGLIEKMEAMVALNRQTSV